MESKDKDAVITWKPTSAEIGNGPKIQFHLDLPISGCRHLSPNLSIGNFLGFNVSTLAHRIASQSEIESQPPMHDSQQWNNTGFSSVIIFGCTCFLLANSPHCLCDRLKSINFIYGIVTFPLSTLQSVRWKTWNLLNRLIEYVVYWWGVTVSFNTKSQVALLLCVFISVCIFSFSSWMALIAITIGRGTTCLLSTDWKY